MELRHLRYFAAVARELNFGRAAQQLHIAQPPLSRQIRQLEEELGAELFDRKARPLRLTPAGQFFHTQTLQLLERIGDVCAMTERMARGARPWFGIGFVPSALYGLLPEVIRRFRMAQPSVEVGLIELTTVLQIDALKAGRIDVGFGRLSLSDPRISGEVVSEEAMVVALPTGHPLARRKRLSLAQLAREPLLLYPAKPRPSYADQVLEVFRSHGIQPTISLEANELQTVIGLVVSGIGYALVPESVQGLRRDGVDYVPLSDKGSRSPIIMNIRAGDASPLLAEFQALVMAVSRELSKT
ncbi:LysR family transcriptional regulator [Comamonas thiooxydans]|nr:MULTISPECIES: LysR family transcriptional regulator [Comamonas]MDO1476735.1 LysR family transcriptional regulator [Comamonas thiooxydans]